MDTKQLPITGLLESLKTSVVIFDGAMGTEIYRNHVFTNACFDELNLSRGDLIRKIFTHYLESGAEVLTTNTIGANAFALQKFGLADQVGAINAAGVALARRAISEYREKNPKEAEKALYVGASVGPAEMEDVSHLTTDEKVAILAQQVGALSEAGADFIIFETQPGFRALEAAALTMKKRLEETGEAFPFILSLRPKTREEYAKSEPLTAQFQKFVAKIQELGCPMPFAWGLNCGLGPDEMLEALEQIIPAVPKDAPIIVQPEAGRPRRVESRSISMTSPEFFTEYAKRYISLGANGVGGCCGIGPEHILEMARSVKPLANARMRDVEMKDVTEEVVLQEPAPLAERSNFGKMLAECQWITSVELVPPRGFDLSPTIAKCVRLKGLGVNCVNIPDGPRASCKINSLVTADRIQRDAGIETILHFCCRDRNLIGMQSDLLGCAACGVHNILFITGDPPKLGDYPNATGVFDTDSVGMTRIQQRMNRGVDLVGKGLPEKTTAVMGVGLDPTSLDRKREIDRFFRKAEAGAEFAVTQPVFDPDILLDILDHVSAAGVPIIAGIWPLASYRNAFFMKTEVPGVVVPDSIMERMERWESREDQQAEGIQIAREAIERIRSRMAGIQVSAPFGNIDIVARVLE